MNIFYLDENPKKCAEYHCDKHVVKMIIEYAQLLSTAHRLCDGIESRGSSRSGKRQVRVWKLDDSRENSLYLASHINHPSNIWTRSSVENYQWLWQLWYNLCKEYEERYNKTHATWIKLATHLSIPPYNIPEIRATPIPLCMPDEYKTEDPIKAYKTFYLKEKIKFATWKNGVPSWFN
jgi:hypothetical protein